MKRIIVILICLLSFITVSNAQVRRNEDRRRPNISINTNKGRPSQPSPKPKHMRPMHRPKPQSPIVYRHYPEPVRHFPINNIPYRIRWYLYRYYRSCTVINYIGVCNPGYLPGHDMYYEVHLSNGVILLFSTKYKIIH